MRLQESLAGYLFILPAVLVLTTFLLIPILASIALVFTDYGLLSAPQWVGIDNILRLFGDKRMWTCYRNSLIITIGAVAGNNFLGLALAMAINRPMHKALRYFYRTSLFFPVLTTTASLAMVWSFILTRDRGVMNWILGQFGIAPISFLGDTQWAIRSVILYDIWKSCGYPMVIYLAGLQGIPRVLYEAARIDGASGWQLTRHVTLPLITPTAFFSIVMSSIGAFQIFDNAYVLTSGGPGDASRTIAMYIYEVAFKAYEMGYASTVAFSLLLILVSLTALQLWGSRKWVHYA
jgi:multiple sugar transport system permease protein